MGPWRAALLALGLAACETPTFGAVEFSWVLRDVSGGPIISCESAGVARVRVRWHNQGTGVQGEHTFACEDNRGVTSLEVPAGTTTLSFLPQCASSVTPTGEEPPFGTYVVPPPLVRTILPGAVSVLGAMVFLLRTTSCGAAGAPVCAC